MALRYVVKKRMIGFGGLKLANKLKKDRKSVV